MSRGWSRGRGQSVSLPLDTLFKESANRPSASRSAGTVGKWGITSFTSIRTTPHSAVGSGVLNSYGNPKHSKFDYSNALKRNQNNCSFESSNDLIQNTNTANIQSSKPKKFFKSRNAVVASDSNNTGVNKPNSNNKLATSPSKNLEVQAKNSISKSKNSRQEIPKLKISLDKSKYTTKHKYFSAKNLKSDKKVNVNVNSKYISRNKGKVINYAEENSNSPPPILHPENTIQQSENSAISPRRQVEHPPIVLRISKGTSRLISTDSESGNLSPQHTSSNNCTSPHVVDPIESSTSPSHPQESLKLTIRTRDPKILHSTKSDLAPVKEKHSKVLSSESSGESSRAARASRRNQQKNKSQVKDEIVPELEKNQIILRRKSSPQPGSENYDLYCTLASPIANKDEKCDISENIRDVTNQTNLDLEENVNTLHDCISQMETEQMNQKSSVNLNHPSDEFICTSNNVYSKNVKNPARQIGQKHKRLNISQYDESTSTSRFKSNMEDNLALPERLDDSSIKQDSSDPSTALVNYGQSDQSTKFTNDVPQWFVENNQTNQEGNENKTVDLTDTALNKINTEISNSEETQPSVKLVISKKKGSIFKSRALVNDGGNSNGKKRHVYRHKCWQFDEQKTTPTSDESAPVASFDFDDADGGLTRVPRVQPNVDYSDSEPVMSVLCPKEAKGYYTVVRNVKKAHQIQEIGEEQELNDDVEYILDALQDNNPMSTRCLSAITLASKCMTPAFRMHVRAHNTVTKFFRALHDATKDQSLGLCTATVMFVLSQDQLNMDVDRNSLELMLNLLESDVSHQHALDDCGLSLAQLHKNKQKVRELCEEIKSQGKAVHLNLDNITVGQLAMETLLSMTSKRAGEWFKEELRQLGGIEHIVKTVCECCRQVSDYITEWNDLSLDKLRKIERCLRVLENVTQLNEENQVYLLNYKGGIAVDTLIQLYQLCDTKIPLYPTITDEKDGVGVVFRETLLPTLKVLINLTHSFNATSIGSSIVGEKAGVIDTSLHLLLEVQHHIPHQKNFELSILALLLLINLVQYNVSNKLYIMKAKAPVGTASMYNQGKTALLALMEYFYQREQLARLEEQTTDAILDGSKSTEESNKQKTNEEFIEETVSKLLQKAGSHMEHTMVASYVVLLLGYIITDCPEHESVLTSILPNHSYSTMIQVLTKYYKFMNLTGSGDTSIVNHISQTGVVLKYLEQLEKTLIQNKQTSSDFRDMNSEANVKG